MTKRIIAAAFIALGLLGAAAGTATAASASTTASATPSTWYHM
jgi:ABC-type glycerol-3-phosphate transport system substrate-binding protein